MMVLASKRVSTVHLSSAALLFATLLSSQADASSLESSVVCPRKSHLLGERVCRKHCATDADCKASKRRCQCDDVCGLSCLNPEQKCDPVRLDNGRISIEPYNRHGAVARHHCHHGYRLLGSSERVCQSDRQWSGIAASCVRQTQPSDLPQAIDSPPKGGPASCGEPPTVGHADHNGEKRSRFDPGTNLAYACRDGYSADGISMAVCMRDGSWAGPFMACTEVHCLDPGDLDNGHKIADMPYTVGKAVHYECFLGYRLVGTPSLECQPTGAWDASRPQCDKIAEAVCPRLKVPKLGYKVGKDQHAGGLVTFSCEVGYTLSGSSRRVCLDNGTWTGSEVTCNPVDCGTPGPLYHGYIEGQKTTRGSVIKYRCLDATTFDGLSRSATCLETGQWSFPPPKCWLSCLTPRIESATLQLESDPANGKVAPLPFQLPHGSMLVVTCDSKLVVTDSRKPVCHNGSWSVLPHCVPGGCKQRPREIINGVVQYRGNSHGDRARYTCNPGYELVGDKYVVCDGGDWHGAVPHCQPVFCPHPGELLNGKILLADGHDKFERPAYIQPVSHGEMIAYYCHAGYRLSGPSAATCISGSWSPEHKPSCVDSRHPDLPPSSVDMRS